MGRTPIRAKDSLGFIANRCARPFTLESLRMLGEGVADAETIDRVCRLGGGFRMGPFELMDLIGVDVNLASPAPSTSRAASRTLAAEPDPGADGLRGPSWPQDRPRLLRLLRRRAPRARSRPDRGPPLLDPAELEPIDPDGARRCWTAWPPRSQTRPPSRSRNRSAPRGHRHRDEARLQLAAGPARVDRAARRERAASLLEHCAPSTARPTCPHRDSARAGRAGAAGLVATDQGLEQVGLVADAHHVGRLRTDRRHGTRAPVWVWPPGVLPVA